MKLKPLIMHKINKILIQATLVAILVCSCNTIQHAAEMFKKKPMISRSPTNPNIEPLGGTARAEVILKAREFATASFLQEYGWRRMPNLNEDTRCASCQRFLWEKYPYCTCVAVTTERSKSKVYCGCSNYTDSCAAAALQQRKGMNAVTLPLFLFVASEYMQARTASYAEYMSTLYFFLEKQHYSCLNNLVPLVRVEYIKRIEKQNGKDLSKSEYETFMKRSLLGLINECTSNKEKSLNYSFSSNESILSNRSRGISLSQESALRRKNSQKYRSIQPVSLERRGESKFLDEENFHTEEILPYSSAVRGVISEETLGKEKDFSTNSYLPAPPFGEQRRLPIEGMESCSSRERITPYPSQEGYSSRVYMPEEGGGTISHGGLVRDASSRSNLGWHPKVEVDLSSRAAERRGEQNRFSYRSSSSEGGVLRDFMRTDLEGKAFHNYEATPQMSRESNNPRWSLFKGEEKGYEVLDRKHVDNSDVISTIEKQLSSGNSSKELLQSSFDRFFIEEKQDESPSEVELFQKMFGKTKVDALLKTEDGIRVMRQYQYDQNRIRIETANTINELMGKKMGLPFGDSISQSSNKRAGTIVRNTQR